MLSIVNDSTLVIPSPGDTPAAIVTLATDQSTAQAAAVARGTTSVTGAGFDVTGKTKSVTFEACGFVAAAGLTAHFRLYDRSALAYISSELTLPAGTSVPTSVSAAITLAAAAHLIEVHFWVTGGALPTDEVFLLSAKLVIAYS